MAKPGPAQRLPANIVRISFPQIGGLVFFRVAQRWSGDVMPISPRAFVRGLPWADFDMFSVIDGVVDPDSTLREPVPIKNPVTDKMLTKYRYWAQYPEALADHNTIIPSDDFYVVDLANFTEVYNHVITSRVYVLATRDDAVTYFKGSGLLPGQDPDLVEVALVTNTGEQITVNPPDVNFWGGVRDAGWTYHIEPIPAKTIYTRDEVAAVIVNLAKLFKDVPLDPATRKKPAQVKFTITLPVRPHFLPGHGARLSWSLSASAWSPKLSDPVLDFERRDFPVQDRTVPIRGIPGAFNYEYHVPTFPHPQAQVQSDDLDQTELKVGATITFGVGRVPPKIELALQSVVGGGVG